MSDTTTKDTFKFVDSNEYKQLQEDFPAESLAEVNSVIDPETGEFNWDCPCLGGMAQPPCGSFFKEAFTCFANSESEPKGIDCIDQFKAMQDCFRQFPELYPDELKDKDDDDDSEEGITKLDEKDSQFTQNHDNESPVKEMKA